MRTAPRLFLREQTTRGSFSRLPGRKLRKRFGRCRRETGIHIAPSFFAAYTMSGVRFFSSHAVVRAAKKRARSFRARLQISLRFAVKAARSMPPEMDTVIVNDIRVIAHRLFHPFIFFAELCRKRHSSRSGFAKRRTGTRPSFALAGTDSVSSLLSSALFAAIHW